jgi:hypothetical protein
MTRAARAVVFGDSNDRELKSHARPASATEGSFNTSVLSTIAAENAYSSPAASLLATIAESIGKIYPPSLEQYGITARDRLGPKSGSLWELASRIGKSFGVEVELYEHAGAEPAVIVEPFEMPALVVSQTLRRLPVPQQAFLLAYGIASIATRLHPALWLRTAELEIALTGAVRIVAPNFGASVAGEQVETAREALRKFVVRKWRRPMELAAQDFATKPPADLALWQASIKQTMFRTALLVADDLAASLEAMRLLTELPDARGSALVQRSDAVRDLMRFWISNRAASVRQHAGIVAS